MARIPGYLGTISAGGNAVGQIIDYTWNPTVTMMDATRLGVAYEDFDAGITGGTISINSHMDIADTGQESITEGASLAIILRPNGAGSGLPERTFTVRVSGVQESANPRENARRDFTANIISAVTRATQP